MCKHSAYHSSMQQRTLEPFLKKLSAQYPVVSLTGPRQSGKTTLCRMAFPHKAYVNLEAPDERQFALEDPRGFLKAYQAIRPPCLSTASMCWTNIKSAFLPFSGIITGKRPGNLRSFSKFCTKSASVSSSKVR